MPLLRSAFNRMTAAPAVNPNLYSTSFPTVENPLSEGGIWIDGGVVGGVVPGFPAVLNWNSPLVQVAGQCVASVNSDTHGGVPPSSRYDDSIAVLNKSFTADQFAQATIYKAVGYTTAGGHEVELLLRSTISNGNTLQYEVLWGISGYIAVVKWTGAQGAYVAIFDPGGGSAPVPADGDVFRAEIQGSVIKAYINGVEKTGGGITDSSYTTGQPGMGFWPVDGADRTKMGFKAYSAGSL